MNDEMSHIFSEYQLLLFSIAYRICHSKEEAEDILQEVHLQWLKEDFQQIENPKAFLSKLVVNRSINYVKSARKQRVDYYGPWLPEPSKEYEEDPILGKEKITYALLVVLELLSPQERIVFLLKEIFGYSHKEIAEILEIEIPNSRKLLSRSKKKLKETNISTDYLVSEKQKYFIKLFKESIEKGNLTLLIDHLTKEAKMSIDGGQKRRAPLRTLVKSTRIYAFLKGVYVHDFFGDEREFISLYNQPCLLVKEKNKIKSIIFLGLTEDQQQIQQIFMINNPSKLKKLL